MLYSWFSHPSNRLQFPSRWASRRAQRWG